MADVYVLYFPAWGVLYSVASWLMFSFYTIQHEMFYYLLPSWSMFSYCIFQREMLYYLFLHGDWG